MAKKSTTREESAEPKTKMPKPKPDLNVEKLNEILEDLVEKIDPRKDWQGFVKAAIDAAQKQGISMTVYGHNITGFARDYKG